MTPYLAQGGALALEVITRDQIFVTMTYVGFGRAGSVLEIREWVKCKRRRTCFRIASL